MYCCACGSSLSESELRLGKCGWCGDDWDVMVCDVCGIHFNRVEMKHNEDDLCCCEDCIEVNEDEEF